MKKFIAIIAVLISLVLTSCDTNAGTVDLMFNETSAEITETTYETINMNNCGGKGDAKQIAERSKSVHVEYGGKFGVSKEHLSGEVSAKYGQVNESAKKMELIAPAGTNMEFTVLWTEKTWAGIITEQGKDDQANYKVSVPISVALTESRDLGCDLTAVPSDTPVEISAYCGQFGKSPIYTDAGQDIVLKWGWLAETNAYRQDYIDHITFSLQIDGKELDTSSATITLSVDEDGYYRASWRMPPLKLSEGKHQVELTSTLDHQIMDGFDNDNDGKVDVFEPGTLSAPPCEIIVQ